MEYVQKMVDRQRLIGFALFLIIFPLILINCGGGGGGDSETAATSDVIKYGAFIDSAVSGINYSTPTQSGVTDENGTFQYLSGEMITFRIGNLLLGTTTVKSLITPMDLVPGAMDHTDTTVTNLCKLLQALDEDGYLPNGIDITNAIRAIVSDSEIDFLLSPSDFDSDQNIQDLLTELNDANVFTDSTARDLPSDEDAQNHLADTIGGIGIILEDYIGTWSGSVDHTSVDESGNGEISLTVNANGTGTLTSINGHTEYLRISSISVVDDLLHFEWPVADPIHPDCQDWDLQATLSVDGTFQASGTVCGDEGGETGSISGNLEWSELSVPNEATFIDGAFLQYRTKEDDSRSINGWISFSNLDNSFEASDITQIVLKNDIGNTIPISDTAFYSEYYTDGVWNNDTSTVDYSEKSYAGISIRFSGLTTLPSGYYTYEATTSAGHKLIRTVYYHGDISLPCVDSDSMTYEWQIDGSLYLTWDAPVGNNFSELKIYMNSEDNTGVFKDILYLTLPIDAMELIIPSAQIQQMTNSHNPWFIYWNIQTRARTTVVPTYQYARGMSDSVSLFWTGATVGSTYHVYGGATYPSSPEGYSPGDYGYEYLGTATGTSQFIGVYDYYIIVTDRLNVAYVDTVEDSDGQFDSYTAGGSNSIGIPNIRGGIDENYAEIGGSGGANIGGGFAVINAPGAGFTSITVHIKP